MKKVLIIILMAFLITGCEIKKINTNSRDEIINDILYKDFKLYNRISRGYKYYLPNGLSLIDFDDYNEKLLSGNNTYYLYVDIISYYYKKNIVKENVSGSYYYKRLNYNDKTGYILITRSNDNKFLIEYEYNYGKIETKVLEKQINETLINISYILSSLQFNNLSIESIVGNNVLDFSEEKYKLDSPQKNEQTFDVYVETYDKYNDENSELIEE